jgi:hypothetical protein
LPNAYRNAHTAVAAAAISPHLDGIPSFQPLQNEPIRREAFVVACVLTLAAIATFGHVMELPFPNPAVERNGPMSPIESVLEHLNQPTSTDSANNVRSEVPPSAATVVSRPVNRSISTTNAAPAPITKFVAIRASQPAGLEEQNSNTNYSDHRPLHAAASSSPVIVQNLPEAVPVGARSVSPSNTQAVVIAVASLSGKWTESLRTVSEDADIPHLFFLDQHSAALGGTGGPDFTDQYPIIHGSVAGDYVRFELNYERKSFLYALKVEGGQLRGTLSIRSANGIRTATTRLARVSGK